MTTTAPVTTATPGDRVALLIPNRLELVETPRWKPTFVLRGLEALRVRI